MSDQNTGALQRVDPASLGLPVKPITDIAEAQDALSTALRSRCNVLAPLTKLGYLPDGYQLSIRTVFAPPIPANQRGKGKTNGHWWVTENGKPALTRAALDQLSQAAGITDVESKIQSPEAYLWICTHTVAMRDLDGRERRVTRTKEVDLRDGSPMTAGKSDRFIARAREHGAAVCQSKATNRCIRAALGVKGSYEWHESERPFVFPVLQFVPNMSDPMIARMVAAKELGVIDQLFGAQAAAEVANHDRGDVLDARDLPPSIGAAPMPEVVAIAENVNDPAGEEPGPPRCADCGLHLSRRRAGKALDLFGEFFCEDHEPEPGQ